MRLSAGRLLLLLPVLLILGCEPPDRSGPDLAGVLDTRTGWLGVTPETQLRVLDHLRAVQRDTLNLYTGLLGRDTLFFSVHQPAIPLDILADAYPEDDSAVAKIYFNARCGTTHPGFQTGCIGTFGPHRIFGNSMEWQVNAWKECAAGDTICIEQRTRVGTITYYQGLNCSDTLFVKRGIFRWACR